MVEYLYEQGSGGDDTVYGSGQRRKPIIICVRFVVIWNRELHFHHTDVRQSQTISIGLSMMQMLSPAMALWKKAIICMIMLYFMREKK